MVGFSPLLLADENVRCPKNIAAIENDKLTDRIIPLLIQVYKNIGCSLNVTLLPGRRGIHYFNTGKVDGEVYRFSLVEEKYERPFVRSQVPLFMLSNSVWRHPDYTDTELLPVGYAIGALWQEEYVKNRETRSYRSGSEVLRAYNAGEVAVFVAPDTTVIEMIKTEGLTPPPVRVEVIHKKPLYHYLSVEFAPFIAKLTDEIKKNDPFRSLGTN